MFRNLEEAFGLTLADAKLPPDADREGEVRIDRFVLRREIGHGGFGVVYLADDPQLGRQIALKVPRTELLLDEANRQRLLHEGRAAATLNHPNIVAVHEAGEVGPIVYIAMAYCAGPSLSQWLKDHPEPMAPRDAARLIAALADATQHAHSRGVLHRDLKPGNVLLVPQEHGSTRARDSGSPDGDDRNLNVSERIPKIVDFGLARRIDDPSATQTGMVLGTPAYMSPEQAAGQARDIGTHSDIYALGVILFELLTGRPPFVGTGADVILRVQQDDPPRPRMFRADVPRDLETICLKCLVKDPRNRYSTAGALADDLHRWLRGEPITARPANLVSRTWLWAKRKPALASALVLLVLAVGAGISGTVWGLVQAREQLAQRQAADRVDFELTEAFNCIGKARFGQAIRISERCAAIMEDLFRRNPGSPWFQWHLAACYDALGEAWRGLGAIDRSAAALERSIALHKAFLDIVPDSINVNRSYTHSLERLTAAYYLLPSSTQAVIDVMATRNDLHRRLSSSCERKRYEFQRIADNLEELGDYFLIQSKASEALDHYSRARQVVADHLQGAPVSTQFVAALDQRIDLVIRLLEGDDGIAVDLVKLLSSPELLILLQRQFQGRNDPVAVAAVSHQMVTHRDGYFATWAGARGFAWAAEAGPPGSLRAEYGRRCEDCLARLLLYSDEAAERVKSEPLFARYRHLWDSPR